MKIYLIIPILMSLMLLSACGGSSDSSDDDEVSSSSFETETIESDDADSSSSTPSSPVIQTELEGKWRNLKTGTSGVTEFEQIYIFSGNEYDFSSGSQTESGTFVTGASFTNNIGLEVTRIIFNRELLNGELATDSQSETYYFQSQNELLFGNRSGELRSTIFYRF